MSASKDWNAKLTDFKREPIADNKRYNAKKFKELHDLLDQACEVFSNHDQVSTLTRKIVEETTNIIEHNQRWNWIKVITQINPSANNFKATITYDGGEYFDPIFNNVGNVCGSKERFQEYLRPDTPEIDASGIVTIKVQIILKDS